MVKAIQIVSLLVILVISSCSTEKQITSTPPIEIAIALQKTPCYGECPVYNFQILNNNRTTLSVGRITSEEFGLGLKEGDYEGTISNEVIQEIIQLAEALNYFKLNTNYDDEKIMDLPAAISSIEGHRVFNRFEGPNLEDLYSFIESKISDVQWHSINEN